MIELADVPLFRGMEPKVLSAISSVFQTRHVELGDSFFRQGDPGDSLVVVLDGLFELVSETSTGEVHLADVAPGRVLGLVSLVDPGPRTATLRAMEDGTLAVLDRSTFLRLWEAQGDAAARLHYQLSLVAIEELRSANRKLLELLREPLENQAPPSVKSSLGLVRAHVYQSGFFR